MAENDVLNIVILGGSFSSISLAHNFLSHTLPKITKDTKFSYRLIIVSPSTRIYWNISAPRALVSSKLVSHDEHFLPFIEKFDKYPPGTFQHILGTATSLDTKSRTVTISCEPAPAPPSYDDVERGANNSPQTLTSKAGAAITDTISAVASLGSPTSTLGSARPEREPTAWGPFAPGATNSQSNEVSLKYHALVIATGSTAHSPLLSLRGPYENTKTALDTFHAKLPTADTICVAGGGPSGVETAGQLAYWLNKRYGPLPHQSQRSHFPTPANMLSLIRKNKTIHAHFKKIILLAGSERLLPKLHPSLGVKAKRKLERLGVRVILEVRVNGAMVAGSTGKTTLKLSNDTTMACDLYVPCTGVIPNTQYLPRESPLLRRGYIATVPSPSTLRVEIPPDMMPADEAQLTNDNGAGATKAAAGGIANVFEGQGNTPTSNNYNRVYAVGDVADFSMNCILDTYTAVPVLLHNLTNDLLIHQQVIQNPYGGNNQRIEELQDDDIVFVRDDRDSQICPIGAGPAPGGVGVVFNHRLIGAIVWLFKGRTYVVDKGAKAVEKGLCPYPEG
ncbi:MAG: hypothetical protein M1828_002071 [Chrysothrix sp. TS-e1954]|nr:MAG: hypothetical protein M1828_002071 [Chrysothrix sp. TS-e1954]